MRFAAWCHEGGGAAEYTLAPVGSDPPVTPGRVGRVVGTFTAPTWTEAGRRWNRWHDADAPEGAADFRAFFGADAETPDTPTGGGRA